MIQPLRSPREWRPPPIAYHECTPPPHPHRSNAYGQLGIAGVASWGRNGGETIAALTPLPLAGTTPGAPGGGDFTVTAITAGSRHTCVLMSADRPAPAASPAAAQAAPSEIRCWGYNDNGTGTRLLPTCCLVVLGHLYSHAILALRLPTALVSINHKHVQNKCRCRKRS